MMALAPERERLEHELRVEQMQTNIDEMRREMRADTVEIAVSVVGHLHS